MTQHPRPGARRRAATAAGAVLVLACGLPGPAAAEGAIAAGPGGAAPLSAEEFRAFAEGWTLHFELHGAPFGTETFGPGGQTLWRPEGGACTPGLWAAIGQEVCFFYGDDSACWRLWRDAGGVVARSSPDGDMEVRVRRRDRAPLDCAEDLLSGQASGAFAS
jgi:hypothetical protein